MKLVETRHPDDERLIARYFEAVASDEWLDGHLLRCDGCAARRDELARLLDADYDRALAATGAAFGAERLGRQRAEILRRIDVPATPRVVPFSPRPGQVPFASRVVRQTSRWAAAAAILVFTVSAGTGWWGDERWMGGRSEQRADAALAGSIADGEDALLLEIDLALARPQTRELRALEALTPRAGEPVSLDF